MAGVNSQRVEKMDFLREIYRSAGRRALRSGATEQEAREQAYQEALIWGQALEDGTLILEDREPLGPRDKVGRMRQRATNAEQLQLKDFRR